MAYKEFDINEELYKESRRNNFITKVMNISGTSDDDPQRCGFDTWIDYWEDITGGSCPKTCTRKGCHNGPDKGEKKLNGSHVYDADSSPKIDISKWYIVPLCTACNKEAAYQHQPFELDDFTTLAEVDLPDDVEV